MHSTNPATFTYVALREIGQVPSNWMHQRRFAAIYPRSYYGRSDAVAINWQMAYQTEVASLIAHLVPEQKNFFEAILGGNLAQCERMLSPNNLEQRVLIKALFTSDFLFDWVTLNPCSRDQPHFSIDINERIWRYVNEADVGFGLLLQFALITHQPVSVIKALLGRFPVEDLRPLLFDGLSTAVQLNQHTIVQYLLAEQHVDPNGGDDHHDSPIVFAGANRNIEMIELLLRYQANPRYMSSRYHDWQPIHLAAQSGHAGIVRLLLQYGASVHGLCVFDERHLESEPIDIACQHGRFEVTKVLLEHGANTSSYQVVTTLHIACERKNTALVKLLIEYGLDINSPDDGCLTPVHRACEEGFDVHFIYFLLHETNADWFRRDPAGLTPLNYLEAHGMDQESLIYILRYYVNHLDLTAINLDDSWHARAEMLAAIYNDTIAPLCATHPDLLLQYAILSRQDLEEIDRIIAAGASRSGATEYLQLPCQLAAKLHPAVCHRFNVLEFDFEDLPAELGAVGFFNSDENDTLASQEEFNPKKRARQ